MEHSGDGNVVGVGVRLSLPGRNAVVRARQESGYLGQQGSKAYREYPTDFPFPDFNSQRRVGAALFSRCLCAMPDSALSLGLRHRLADEP